MRNLDERVPLQVSGAFGILRRGGVFVVTAALPGGLFAVVKPPDAGEYATEEQARRVARQLAEY